jgi:hypothetical protein
MGVLRFLNNTSLFVSLGALFTFVFGVVICHEQIIVTHALNAFFLTWCAYQFIKPIHSKYRKTYMVIASTGACLNALFLPLHFIIPGVIGIALTLLYKNDWRTNGTGQPAFSLRNHGWLKFIATALAWTLVTSWWMVVNAFEIEKGEILLPLLFSQFCWIGALAIAGDLRDIDSERIESRTLPMRWGRIKAKVVCTGLFVFSAALLFAFLLEADLFEMKDAVVLCCIYVIALIVTWSINSNKNWHRLTIILDGLLVLKGIGAILCLMV